MDREIVAVEIQVLVDNNASHGSLLGEHGFSALVNVSYDDSSKFQFLYDTGAGTPALDYNIKALEKNLSSIEMIILSHGHYDHSAGLLKILEKIGKPVPVLLHPHALLHKISISDEGKRREIGIHRNYDESELANRTKIISSTEPYEVADGIMTTGFVPRTNDFELLTGVLKKIVILQEGTEIPDMIEDDLSLIFQLKDNSVVILTGCCHSGILNTTNHVINLIGSPSKIGILGGLHLHNASDMRLEKTIQGLKEYPITTLAPCHCTGLRGRAALLHSFDESFKDISVGSNLKFNVD